MHASALTAAAGPAVPLPPPPSLNHFTLSTPANCASCKGGPAWGLRAARRAGERRQSLHERREEVKAAQHARREQRERQRPPLPCASRGGTLAVDKSMDPMLPTSQWI